MTVIPCAEKSPTVCGATRNSPSAPQHSGILPRGYQTDAIDAATAALGKHGNTLLAIPTGGGKTITALLIAAALGVRRVLILVHRVELVEQWVKAAALVLPGRRVTTVTAGCADFSGNVVVAMVPTLCRRLGEMRHFDLVTVDEAHHAPAPTWLTCINSARTANPKLLLLGVTATPERADGKGLRRVFSNVAYSLPVRELIETGHLVQPRALTFDVADAAALDRVAKGAAEAGDQTEVGALLNTAESNRAIVGHWREHAAGRRTVAFTSTVAHAHDLAAAFADAGIGAAAIDGRMPDRDRADVLRRLTAGSALVVPNAMVLTEGFDEPLVGSVILARCYGHKSSLVQAAGRGLRTVDPVKHPGVVKTDCVLLDVARNFARHGDLIAGLKLDDRGTGDAPTKICPECEAEVPAAVPSCPLCGYEFPKREEAEAAAAASAAMERARLIEVDVINRSPFAWLSVADRATVAVGFKVSVAVVEMAGVHCAVGLERGKPALPLRIGLRHQCVAAADDFMRLHEDGDAAHKSARWLTLPASDKQVEHLRSLRIEHAGMSRYAASARLTWEWSARKVRAATLQAVRGGK